MTDSARRAAAGPLERVVFGARAWIVGACVVVTVVMALHAARIELNTSYLKMIPTGHPYVQNYLDHRDELSGTSNLVRIAVANPDGSILEPEYLETLKDLNDELLLVPGVDRSFMQSIWTPNTRWRTVTEQGYDGGPVMPDGMTGTEAQLRRLRANIERSGEIGRLVANDWRSSVIVVPLLDVNPDTGKPLDYRAFADRLEQLERDYEARGVELHVVGFARLVGEIINGLTQVAAFFGLTVAIAMALLWGFSRCLRSTLLVVGCSLTAVIWQVGLLQLLGLSLDPYSILVPFLVFAIGMSHGAQKMNGILQEVAAGADRLTAARLTFRRLFYAGIAALISDAVGFAVMGVIEIPVIRELAMMASFGVGALIVTNLILLPLLLTLVGVSRAAAERSVAHERASDRHPVWQALDRLTRTGPAATAVSVAVVLALGAAWIARDLAVGDLDEGAPELRPESRYNRDAAFFRDHYAASSDVLIVMVDTQRGQCASYEVLSLVDALAWRLRALPGVTGTQSAAGQVRVRSVGMNEGNGKWGDLLASQGMLNAIVARLPRGSVGMNCDFVPLSVYLADHRAGTLQSVVAGVEAFRDRYAVEGATIRLAAGNAGIEAATAQVVERAFGQMVYIVFAAVGLVCLVVFRSPKAVLTALLPLVAISVLCEALMVGLGIGVKVATLPVIALGVGIGVDYAVYLIGVLWPALRAGVPLGEAYYRTLVLTGRIVIFTGLTLSLGVAPWMFSPIKFQADLGALLAFMFLGNMIAAVVLVPALTRLLPGVGRAARKTRRAPTGSAPRARSAPLWRPG
ncbi:efflux RND transporter permease subunit [Arhodomonas sp. SL1]|uniref:efflux RND transporter permease subunit n=1 Tax=Arhodomonas sp. SL1 TaxID=3425691 RepID=UPI003F883A51